jgi:hypothetical protein
MDTGLAVIETRWWEDGNHSVRGLFESVCGLATGNPFSFRYDMFCDESSLSTSIKNVWKDKKYKSVYLAAHGNETTIQGSTGHSISRTKLRNIIHNANKGSRLTGFYFGSCLICNDKTVRFLLHKGTGIRVKWIAGYSKSVDWVISSCVDMIFWSFLIQENLKSRKSKKTDLQIALYAASEMKRVMPTIFNELGFNVYYLDGGHQLTKVW